MFDERPKFWRIITIQFNKKENIYSNIPMYSNNDRKEDLRNARNYAKANNYRFIKPGECVTDEEHIRRGEIECNWYKYEEK
jgi:hypothetical protein